MISLQTNEKILFEMRKHWFVFFGQIVYLLFLILLPILIFSFINPNVIFQGKFFISWIDLFFFFLFYFQIIWIQFFVFWTNYYLDVWLVTDQRIIDIEQISLFHREVSVMHYDKIQDVTAKITGIIGSLLNFGDVEVQTAATDRKFLISGVHNPVFKQKKINEIILKYNDKI